MELVDFAKHWNYYLSLEKDLEETRQFVEHIPENYSTYSNEFAKLILLSCAEFEIACKALCNEYRARPSSLKAIFCWILDNCPDIKDKGTQLQYGIKIYPFREFDPSRTCGNLRWWQAYNNLKHNRIKNFGQASLENTVLSTSALLIILSYLKATYTDAARPLFLTNYISAMQGTYPLLSFR